MMLQRSLRYLGVRFGRSTRSHKSGSLGQAVPRTDELDEAHTGLAAVLQRSASILCGLSERTTTQKVLHIGAEGVDEEEKTFCYFLGKSSVFDVSGLVFADVDTNLIESSGNYSEVISINENGGIPGQLRRNSFPYIVMVSPSSNDALISPSKCLEYTIDEGYVIYGLKERLWEQMGTMDELMSLAGSGQGEVLSIQTLEGFNLALLKKN